LVLEISVILLHELLSFDIGVELPWCAIVFSPSLIDADLLPDCCCTNCEKLRFFELDLDPLESDMSVLKRLLS
jgi:hypothetical protein